MTTSFIPNNISDAGLVDQGAEFLFDKINKYKTQKVTAATNKIPNDRALKVPH
jgi:hypothetical protein